jgi:hypothetical protein
VVTGRKATSIYSSQINAISQIAGDVIELKPALYNVLLFTFHDGGATPNTSVQDTLQYKRVDITPRYSLF